MASPPIPDAIEYLWGKLHELEPTSELGGIYAPKTGYHDTRKNNPPDNYSVVDDQDRGGPDNLAAALDWTFPEAQHGDYTRISKYCKRLLDSGEDPDDDRLNWMREFYGQADKDSAVEGWDFRYVGPVTSDPSHLWHIHFSFSRDALTRENMDLLLEVLVGDDMSISDADVDKIIDGFLAKKVTVPDLWKAMWPDDEGIQDGTISLLTAWRSGYLHGRLGDEELTGGPEALEVPSKLDTILAILQGGVPVPGVVNVSPESVAEIKEAVADEVAERLAD